MTELLYLRHTHKDILSRVQGLKCFTTQYPTKLHYSSYHADTQSFFYTWIFFTRLNVNMTRTQRCNIASCTEQVKNLHTYSFQGLVGERPWAELNNAGPNQEIPIRVTRHLSNSYEHWSTPIVIHANKIQGLPLMIHPFIQQTKLQTLLNI